MAAPKVGGVLGLAMGKNAALGVARLLLLGLMAATAPAARVGPGPAALHHLRHHVLAVALALHRGAGAAVAIARIHGDEQGLAPHQRLQRGTCAGAAGLADLGGVDALQAQPHPPAAGVGSTQIESSSTTSLTRAAHDPWALGCQPLYVCARGDSTKSIATATDHWASAPAPNTDFIWRWLSGRSAWRRGRGLDKLAPAADSAARLALDKLQRHAAHALHAQADMVTGLNRHGFGGAA